MDSIDRDSILAKMNTALKYLQSQSLPEAENCEVFVQKLFDNEEVSDLLIHLSRLPVFNKEFAEAFKENLDLLATAKKLKFFTNLTLAHNALLIRNLGDNLNVPLNIKKQVEKLFNVVKNYKGKTNVKFGNIRLKDHMATKPFGMA